MPHQHLQDTNHRSKLRKENKHTKSNGFSAVFYGRINVLRGRLWKLTARIMFEAKCESYLSMIFLSASQTLSSKTKTGQFETPVSCEYQQWERDCVLVGGEDGGWR